MRNDKTIHCGTITALELAKAPRGHSPRSSGCGFYKNRRKDKKLNRREGKSACNG